MDLKIKDAIATYLTSEVLSGKLDDNRTLFSSGILDSISKLSLVTFLEKTFKIEVRSEEVNVSNFESLSTLTSFVERKLKAKN